MQEAFLEIFPVLCYFYFHKIFENGCQGQSVENNAWRHRWKWGQQLGIIFNGNLRNMRRYVGYRLRKVFF